MNKNLKSAVKGYSLQDQKINYIHQLDAEIIVEIHEALKKIKQEDLKSIIGEWKSLPDEDVRDMLIEFNLKTNHEEVETNKPKFQRRFVIFDDLTLDVHLIISIGRKSYYDYNKCVEVYHIVINEHTTENYPYHNTIIEYSDFMERDMKYEELHELLLSTQTIIFY